MISTILEFWLSECYSCVKWHNVWSDMFLVKFGVKQGSVLSPFLFAIYVDDLAKQGLTLRGAYIILYADDILFITRSVCRLEYTLRICESELSNLDMAINCNKSCCLRIGQRCDVSCAPISSSLGIIIPWVTQLRYLGVFITQSRTVKCALDYAKKSFYRSANMIFGKIGRTASDFVLELIKSKCVPCLMYGLDACYLNKSQLS